jgi:hypothetical protein
MLQYVRSVKVLWLPGWIHSFQRLHFPSSKMAQKRSISSAAADLAAFEPFVSARKETGRPVNVFQREMPRFD